MRGLKPQPASEPGFSAACTTIHSHVQPSIYEFAPVPRNFLQRMCGEPDASSAQHGTTFRGCGTDGSHFTLRTVEDSRVESAGRCPSCGNRLRRLLSFAAHFRICLQSKRLPSRQSDPAPLPGAEVDFGPYLSYFRDVFAVCRGRLEWGGEEATALGRGCKSIRIPKPFVSAKRKSQG